MYKYSRNLELLYETPSDLAVDQGPPKNNLKALVKKVLKEERRVLTEVESKRFLYDYGIPTVRTYVAQNVEEAVTVAKMIGYPVVMKILSPDIVHKTDVGGVVLNITSEEMLKREYERLLQDIKERLPEAKIEGVTIQKMIEGIDYELILGSKKDKDFGSVIIVGLGGIEAEILKNFAVGLPPLNQTLARRLIEDSGIYEMLKGYRGKAPADMRILEQAIVSFSNLIVDFPEISEMDINPIVISKGKPFALDARIILDTTPIDPSFPYPHLVITPYPTKYVMPWRLSDGREVLLRPIRPEDEPLEYEMLTSLSEESLKQRFFQVIRNIDHEMLTRFCNIDYEREMAIVAEYREGSKKRIVGIGRLVIEPYTKNGEFAVVVHDQFQGKGLGYKLMDVLVGIAQDKGLRGIYGIVLSDNVRMLRAAKRLGFVEEKVEDGFTRVTLELNP